MDMSPLRFTLFIVISLMLLSFSEAAAGQTAPKREMRGVWVSTVANIDWPSKSGLSMEELQKETKQVLDRVKELGFNTVFFQARPSSDAFYISATEPWSTYLTGIQGIAPENNFDPLQYWVEEAHKRGIQLHAWINPFRATNGPQQQLNDNHISKTHPEWMINYNKKEYIDPGNPQARKYIVNIISDITERYDIDGIHIDDYFYPYPSGKEKFDDDISFEQNNKNQLSLADWRRQNINSFVESVQQAVKKSKPWIVFGASPFGVWRNEKEDPKGSKTTAGTTAYDVLYADVLTWMKNGWVDYVVPQIYWEADHPSAGFDTLVQWWACQQGSRCFVGHALYKIGNGTSAWDHPDEMPNQLAKVRQSKELGGSVLFSYKHLNRNLMGLDLFLRDEFYKTKALVPTLTNSESKAIEMGKVKKKKHILHWNSSNEDEVRFYIIYRYRKNDQFTTGNPQFIYDVTDQSVLMPERKKGDGKYFYVVAPMDKYGKEHGPSKKIKMR